MIKTYGFYNRIREYRLSHGLSQKQLAARVGVCPASIRDYERQRFQPGAEVALNLCIVFHCDFFDLFGFESIWVSDAVVTQSQDPGAGAAG